MSKSKFIAGRAARAGSLPQQGFIPVRGNITGKLCFFFDPDRDLIEIQLRDGKELIDLTEYRKRGLTNKPGSW